MRLLFAFSSTLSVVLSTAAPVLGPGDGLLIIDVQNSFLPARPVPQDPSYPIPEVEQVNGTINAGSLEVDGGDQILPVINDLIDAFNAAKAPIFASLDWHPAEMCSFCSTGGICAMLSEATCGTDGTANNTSPDCPVSLQDRCMDPVSVSDYKSGTYFQWPPHCVQRDFGSRFDAALKIPSNASVVKKGFRVTEDSYSAYGGTHSVQAYPFDTTDNITDLSTRPSLKTLVEGSNVTRLFVVGLATDYCVKNSILDSLGINVGGISTKPSSIVEVVFVAAAARGVVPRQSEDALALFENSGVQIVPANITDVQLALDHLAEHYPNQATSQPTRQPTNQPTPSTSFAPTLRLRIEHTILIAFLLLW